MHATTWLLPLHCIFRRSNELQLASRHDTEATEPQPICSNNLRMRRVHTVYLSAMLRAAHHTQHKRVQHGMARRPKSDFQQLCASIFLPLHHVYQRIVQWLLSEFLNAPIILSTLHAHKVGESNKTTSGTTPHTWESASLQRMPNNLRMQCAGMIDFEVTLGADVHKWRMLGQSPLVVLPSQTHFQPLL
jgi:hypothetical protein